MAETLAAQLTSVQAAIAAIESGAQSIGAGDRTLTRANLDKLYEREKDLLKRISFESQSGARRALAEF